jgi:hypothetical protein
MKSEIGRKSPCILRQANGDYLNPLRIRGTGSGDGSDGFFSKIYRYETVRIVPVDTPAVYLRIVD